MGTGSSFHQDLPAEALPFVRELLLQITRKIPSALTPPLRFPAEDLADPKKCTHAAESLLGWLEVSQESVARRAEELEKELLALLGLVEQLEGQTHRAVHRARRQAEEDVTSSHAVREVLTGLEQGGAGAVPPPTALELIHGIVVRIEARERAFRDESMGLSMPFDSVQREPAALRQRIAGVEAWTRSMREKTLRDGLTGLWNRRAWDEGLADEVSRAERYDSPVSVALWDPDHFRALNEERGHPAGDHALQALARRASAALRRSDFLARCDGAAFAAIFPNTAAAQAALAGEKIRSLVEREAIPAQAGPILLTASVGVATWKPGDTPKTLFDPARDALETAKARGRNRVETSDPGREIPHLEPPP